MIAVSFQCMYHTRDEQNDLLNIQPLVSGSHTEHRMISWTTLGCAVCLCSFCVCVLVALTFAAKWFIRPLCTSTKILNTEQKKMFSQYTITHTRRSPKSNKCARQRKCKTSTTTRQVIARANKQYLTMCDHHKRQQFFCVCSFRSPLFFIQLLARRNLWHGQKKLYI